MASSLSEQVQNVLAEPVRDMLPFSAERRAREFSDVVEQMTIAWLVALAETDRQCVPAN